jgi:hypothetical protein
VVAGAGGWKTWTEEAVLRAGFGAESASSRAIAGQIEGASHQSVRYAKFLVAAAVEEGQRSGQQQLRAKCKEEARPLAWFIRNLMFDESSFELTMDGAGGSAPVQSSVFCSHSQWSWSWSAQDQTEESEPAGREEVVCDEHIVRPPVVLAPMNSATMWKALEQGAGGLQPEEIQDIPASFRAFLVTADAHAANLKLLRHLDSTMDASELLCPLICCQHRTGNVVEQITGLLGNLGGCFCVSRVLNSNHALKILRRRMKATLDSKLIVLAAAPVGLHAEWATGRARAKSFVETCAAFEGYSSSSQESGTLRAAYLKLLEFFNAPWTGPTVWGREGVGSGAVCLLFLFVRMNICVICDFVTCVWICFVCIVFCLLFELCVCLLTCLFESHETDLPPRSLSSLSEPPYPMGRQHDNSHRS